jgi:AcrR family transcriptional regulator
VDLAAPTLVAPLPYMPVCPHGLTEVAFGHIISLVNISREIERQVRGRWIMPRRYRKNVRATATEQTHARILGAARELHAKQGILTTNWAEIAHRAGVSQATVYRHFPSLDDLIPACAHEVFDLSGLPTPERAAEIFAGETSVSGRLERLVRGTCECFGRSAGWLNAAWREQELIPALGDAMRIQQESIQVLVLVALEGTSASARLMKMLTALLDFPFWKSLRDAGFSEEEAADQVVDLMREQLLKEHIA